MKFFKLAIALAGIALFSACSNDVESFLEEGNGVRGYSNSGNMKPKPKIGNGPVVSKPTTTTTDQSTQSRGYGASGRMQPKPRVGNGPVVSKPTTTTTTDQSTQSRGYNASGQMKPKPRVGTLGSATTTPIANKPTTTSTNKN